MKKNLIKIFIIALCLFSVHRLDAQEVTTRGTDFWLTFGNNLRKSPSEVGLQIRVVSGDVATSGTITFTELGTSITFSVAANNVYTYNINSQRNAVYHDNSLQTTNKSVRIRTTEPVSVYALNQGLNTTDATNILPSHALGTDYYHISYEPGFEKDAYSVIATQNTTRVYLNGALTTTLSAGQVYYRVAALGVDMTGAHITTDKPAAFFAMNQGAYICTGASDMLFQQLPPVPTWGKRFFVPVSIKNRDRVRIMVSQNGTNITQIVGGTVQSVTGGQTTLTGRNAGQWVELEVSSANNGCYIEADKPIGVCTYLTGSNYNAPSTFSDPAQAWLSALEQTTTLARIAPFIPPAASSITNHYAVVITPTATKNNTTLSTNGGAFVPLSGGTWTDHSSSYSFYTLPLSTVTVTVPYEFTNPAGLIIMCYGMGKDESYYYLAGSAMRDLTKPTVATPVAPPAVCAGSTLSLTTPSPISYGDYSPIGAGSWTLNGTYFPSTNTVSYAQNGAALAYIINTSGGTFSSGTVAITVMPSVTPAATITSANNVCEGTSVTYTVSNMENMGTPSYQWLIGGSPIGSATNPTYSYTPTDGDVISCRLTSSEPCTSPVVSNSITMIVTKKRTPSITITAVPD